MRAFATGVIFGLVFSVLGDWAGLPSWTSYLAALIAASAALIWMKRAPKRAQG